MNNCFIYDQFRSNLEIEASFFGILIQRCFTAVEIGLRYAFNVVQICSGGERLRKERIHSGDQSSIGTQPQKYLQNS